MSAVSRLGVVAQIALRNVASNRVKSAIVASIMIFGTMLLVVGTALLDSVESSMQKVITSSLAGQLQVYSDQARDELSLFGGLTASLPDVGEIEDFSAVRQALEQVENVEAVVPMGITIATGTSGNDLDQLLGELREAVAAGAREDVEALRGQIASIAASYLEELEEKQKITNDAEKLERDRATLQEVRTEAFWEAFGHDPQSKLLWLDTRFAPLASDGRLFFMRLLGTDPQRFKTPLRSLRDRQRGDDPRWPPRRVDQPPHPRALSKTPRGP